MRISHQFRHYRAERDIPIPPSFFISNKIGGMLFFDSKKDEIQYYSKVGGSLFKIIDDISVDGKITAIHNQMHTISISRGDKRSEIFVPYFSNSLQIKNDTKHPIQVKLDIRNVSSKGARQYEVKENEGRLIICSEGKDDTIYMAIEGDSLKYDHNAKDKKKPLALYLLSQKISISVSDNEDEAIKMAAHLQTSEQDIKRVQENYLGFEKDFKDHDKAIAYSCVLNATDGMFSQDTHGTEAIDMSDHFSNAGKLHKTMAAHAVLMEGELHMAKSVLLSEIHRHITTSDSINILEAAWSCVLFGKFLNSLCKTKQLYDYFSPEDIKSVALDVSALAAMIQSAHDGNDANIELNALLLSVYDLVHVLTKSGRHTENAKQIKIRTALALQNKINAQESSLTAYDASSILLTAYIYPNLLPAGEWKGAIDKLSGLLDFKAAAASRQRLDSGTFNIEHFGMSCITATVLNRTDPDGYKQKVDSILNDAVSHILYSGLIGRPTYSASDIKHPDKKGMISDEHLLNNVFFLEMMREIN
jgi:hypothetical protein